MTETLARPVVAAAEERARLKEGVHIERSSRRVRTYFGNKLIADSEHVLLVYESKRPTAYWFPIADVRMEYLEQSQQAEDTIRWRLVVKDRITHNAARTYIKTTSASTYTSMGCCKIDQSHRSLNVEIAVAPRKTMVARDHA